MSVDLQYQGEITLIKIQDGANGTGVSAMYDFYLLSASSKPPTVPPIYIDESKTQLTTVEWIEKNTDWRLTMPTGLSSDTPYIWNFKRTEYGSNSVEHSEALIASFWAAAPEVIARYSANQSPPWERDYNEETHNYIIFSYDNGKTWSPVVSGTTLDDIVGGIRIKGKVSVDENAITYAIVPSQNEILFYISSESNEIRLSPDILDLQIQKQYLGMTEIVDLVETGGDKETQKFVPNFSCDLISYTSLNESENLTDIILDKSTTDRPILEYDYDLNKIKFNFGALYDEISQEIYKISADSQANTRYVKIKGMLDSLESFLSIKVNLAVPGDSFDLSFKCPIRYATSLDLASFSIHANGITQSIRNTKLRFDAQGMTISNGGIRINTTKYIPVIINNRQEFEQGTYYVDTALGMIEQKEYVPELAYYKQDTSGNVFEVDNFGNLFLQGSGRFEGSVYATDGVFKGKIQASNGYLENLDIYGELSIQGRNGEWTGIKIRGEYLPLIGEPVSGKTYYWFNEDKQEFEEAIIAPDVSSTVKYYEKSERPGIISTNFDLDDQGEFTEGFYLDPTEGKIWAGTIALGRESYIHDCMIFGKEDSASYGALCNPEKHDGVFVEAYKDGISVLKINTDGQMFIGAYGKDDDKAIVINGEKAEIKSRNFSSGTRGWRINNMNAEFNNLTARGTLKTAVFEYEKISAIGGVVLVRPSAMINEVFYVEGTDNKQVELILETQQIMFRTDEVRGDYYFRIGTNDALNIGSGASTGSLYIRGKEAYVLVKESELSFDPDAQKKVVIKKVSDHEFTKEDLESFEGAVLIGYGEVGDIGIGLNSQEATTTLPSEAISVFQTQIEYNEDTEETELQELPRIVLGKISENDEERFGLTGYGLYADNVNVKGELTSRTESLYSGINSNSQVFKNKNDPTSKIILWAGADIWEKMGKEEIASAIRNAPFRVDLAGRVYASEGEFSGKISGSEIYASKLYATTIYGWEDGERAALEIRDACTGINFVGKDINDREITHFKLTDKEIVANVILKAKKGLQTSTLSITDNLAIGDDDGPGLVRLGLSLDQDKNKLAVIYKSDWESGLGARQIAHFAEDGFHVTRATHLDGEIFYGDQTMEYKKVYQGNSHTLIGYDLYIKS